MPAINRWASNYLGNTMNTGDGFDHGLRHWRALAVRGDPWVIPNVIMPTRTLTKADAGFKKQ